MVVFSPPPRKSRPHTLLTLPHTAVRTVVNVFPPPEMAPRIDCHLHIWSGDHDKFPFNRDRGGSPNFNVPPGPEGLCGAYS
jgi:hypothetical protein